MVRDPREVVRKLADGVTTSTPEQVESLIGAGVRSTTLVVGVRIGREAGLSFFGVDEVNAALKEGKRVTALEPGGALFQRVPEDDENVRLTLSGFTIKVIVEV